MSDEQPGPSKPKQKSDMTIAEYLSLPENQNANLVMPIPWCPHLETISKNFDVKDYDVKRPCEICNNEVRQSLWKCLAFLSRALVSNRATGARNFGQILFNIDLRLRVQKGIHDKKSVTYFWWTNFSLLFAAEFQANPTDISCRK